MGVLLGLAAAFCWGAGDLFITLLTRNVGTPKTLLAIQTFSLLFWAVLLFWMWRSPSAPPGVWVLVVVAGVLHVAGLVLTYRAFELGTLAIVSPIASSFAIVTAILAMIAGERPALLALLGAAMLIVGVGVVTGSGDAQQERTLKGVPEAIGSALAFGTMFWLTEFVKPDLGQVWPLIVLKVMALGYAAIMVASSKYAESGLKSPTSTMKILGVALIAAIADSLAWLAYLYGTSHTYVTVVTALASLFGAVTVFLAWVFLKDRLKPRQWIGVTVVLVGVLLVSV